MGGEVMGSVVKQWKNNNGFTYKFIGQLIGCSIAMAQRLYDGQEPEKEMAQRIKTVARLENLINGNPKDKILLQYELEQITGLTGEEIKQGREFAENRLVREAQKRAPKKPKNIRLIKLDTLKEIRENGFKSVYRDSVTYSPDEINTEIARKEFNIKRKAEKWALKNP